ncbi:MAG: Maf family protein [Christensenellaceae bacterium]|jgi:septum formation protein
MRFILASASPRRKELLSLLIKEYEVFSPDIAEEVIGDRPEEIVKALAQQKAAAVDAENSIVLAADTIVWLDHTVLGKPKSRADAKRMFLAMQGRTHCVYTGVTLYNTERKAQRTCVACTEVTFLPMAQTEIENYLDKNEYQDKAGGYGIQGGAARFVSHINGCFYNVMGLPVSLIYEMLKAFLSEEEMLLFLK